MSSDGTATWFNSYLPGKLCLGDLGARDAAIHAIQSCIPHKTLLPVGVDRISLGGPLGSGQLFAHAKERSQTGETYIYDLKIVGMDGSVHERWDGLRLQAINGTRYREPWPAPLLVPYVERRLRELIPGSPVTIALEERDGVERHARSNSAIGLALGGCVTVRRRADGKPEIPGHRSISTSHTGNLTLAVAGHGRLGCDIEQVTERSASAWRGLLGEQRALLAEIINRNVGEDAATSATRLWAASECLKKAGARFDAPLLFVGSEADGWVLFSSGDFKLATYAAKVRELGTGMVLAVLVEGDDAIL